MQTNPFKPTAGKTPPTIIGREDVLEEFNEGLVNGPGAPGRLMRIAGVRGTGKTVLLDECSRLAQSHGWTVIKEVATERTLSAHSRAAAAQIPDQTRQI